MSIFSTVHYYYCGNNYQPLGLHNIITGQNNCQALGLYNIITGEQLPNVRTVRYYYWGNNYQTLGLYIIIIGEHFSGFWTVQYY